jgi:hypothetical protein
MRENSRFEQTIERDATYGESSCQEDGEKVRREKTREEVRAQGRCEESDSQGRGEESVSEEDLRKKDSGEKVGQQEVSRKEVGRQARAGQAEEDGANDSAWIVGHAASLLIGLRVQAYWLIRRGCWRFGLA